MAEKLSLKQKTFIAEYLIDFNATRAAIASGYSPNTATEQGSRLLTNVKVAAEIERRSGKRNEKLGITAERVLDEIAKLAFFDPRKLFGDDGLPLKITELDDETAAAIAGLEVEEMYEGRGEAKENVGRLRKIKIADKGINLERLGRHLKLFTDKVDHGGKIGVNVDDQLQELLTRASERAAAVSKPSRA